MKNLWLAFALLFFNSFTYAQKNNLPKTETKGDLTEVTLYYENGTIMQDGFYTAEGKLHAAWEFYNLDGSKKCVDTYNYGDKVGVWTYWSKNKITKIRYDANKIVNIEEINAEERVKNNL